MNKFDKLFNECKTAEEVKSLYKKLALLHHPDRGGKTEDMQEVNEAFDKAFEDLKTTHRSQRGETYTKATAETAPMWREIIEALIKMQGITIELTGCFLWVGGNTKQYKEELKAMKFRWHSQKMLWYKCPDWYRKTSGKTWTMDEIRNNFGSQTYDTEREERRVIEG